MSKHEDTKPLAIEYEALKRAEGLYISWPETIKSEVKELVNATPIGWFQKKLMLHRTGKIIKDFKKTIKQVRMTVESLEFVMLGIEEGSGLHPGFLAGQMKRTTEMMVRMMAGYQAEFEQLNKILRAFTLADINTPPGDRYEVGRF